MGNSAISLPSKQRYDEFNDRSYGCNLYSLDGAVGKSRLEGALTQHRSIRSYVEKIVDAWCYVSKMSTGSPYHKDRCYFFYYWLGEIVRNTREGTTNFKNIMDTIYNTLSTWVPNEQCKYMYPDTAKQHFKHMKQMFDYYYDFSGICALIQQDQSKYTDYSGYLREAAEAYNSMNAYCLNQGSDKQYCTENGSTFSTKGSPEEFEEKCESEHGLKPISMAEIGKADPDKLPSENVYALFKEGNTCTTWTTRGRGCNQSVKAAVQGGLRSFNMEDENLSGEIVRNHYRACNGKKLDGTPSYFEPCHFFYYWLGYRIKNEVKEPHELNTVMTSIYGNLTNTKCTNSCSKLYPQMDKNIFDKRKEIFDYSYNYNILSKDQGDNRYLCSEDCSTYLDGLKGAYSSVQSSCSETTGGDTFCNEFNREYENSFQNGEPKLQCQTTAKKPSAGDDFDLGDAVVDGGNDDPPPPPKPKPNPNPNQAGSSGSFSDADLADGVSGGEGKGGSDGGGSHRKEGEEDSSNVTIAVPSALAAVGLPTIAALLFYKYKPFFLRKHNHSGNGRRRRSRRREFNEFDDDDTSTIEYSTTNSNSDLTTATDPSEYSVPYIR
ncbi:KIR protein [Plasmodium coatneyi]|uniref:KIR protein n=1 Tax=Plasmodium coatneyi TaxID=208452 RepID=A0A1B1E2M4_9APIC|nr:KIR protein [Plasmodium coatneyi]ANQ09256.1 KIR protein [Plasmodium coatneyi]